jgi:magnesium-dependent phosphatase 1
MNNDIPTIASAASTIKTSLDTLSSSRNENINIFHSLLSKNKTKIPKLIVFDLDHTLWTPELYTLRRDNKFNTHRPVAHLDVNLFPGAATILQQIRDYQNDHRLLLREQNTTNDTEDVTVVEQPPMIQFAIASRTKSIEWAHDLLHQFQIYDLFSYIEIFPADKKQHFQNIHQTSRIPYQNMIFFDDARDGKYGNCMSVAELGVLAVHCPMGLSDTALLEKALLYYPQHVSTKANDSFTNKLTIIEQDGSITYTSTTSNMNTIQQSLTYNQKQVEGYVHVVFHKKRYGFIQSNKDQSSIFFHFSNIVPSTSADTPTTSLLVQQGDVVKFDIVMDRKSNKPAAHNVVIQRRIEKAIPQSVVTTDTLTLRCFSMNMPFAALLANKYKTLESRNGTMFLPYPDGTIMLLHVGQRIYPDGDRHIEIIKRSAPGWTDEQIVQSKSLPDGYHRGEIVAICQIGTTIEMSIEKRSVPKVEQQIMALGSDSGKMITEIRQVQYLKRSVPFRGQGGIFKVSIPTDVIPDEFIKLIEQQTDELK